MQFKIIHNGRGQSYTINLTYPNWHACMVDVVGSMRFTGIPASSLPHRLHFVSTCNHQIKLELKMRQSITWKIINKSKKETCIHHKPKVFPRFLWRLTFGLYDVCISLTYWWLFMFDSFSVSMLCDDYMWIQVQSMRSRGSGYFSETRLPHHIDQG